MPYTALSKECYGNGEDLRLILFKIKKFGSLCQGTFVLTIQVEIPFYIIYQYESLQSFYRKVMEGGVRSKRSGKIIAHFGFICHICDSLCLYLSTISEQKQIFLSQIHIKTKHYKSHGWKGDSKRNWEINAV